MRITPSLCICLIAISALYAQMPKNQDWANDKPYVVMISLDGFRHDYIDKFGAPELKKLRDSSAWAERMIPGFPSKTFPNHYSIVTGLTPANHGIIGNSFYSREKKDFFTLADRNKVEDPSWYGGIPIWALAENSGMLTASFFWAGSEAPIGGNRPTHWRSYDQVVPNNARLEQAKEWLQLPVDLRPHLITVYFSIIDDRGHTFGPDADKTKEAVLEMDKLIGEFRKWLETLNLPVYLIVTSDHGMTNISRPLSFHDINFGDAVLDYSSTMLHVYHENEKVLARIRRQIEKRKPNAQVYNQQEVGDLFGFNNPDRVGDLVVLCDPPYRIIPSPRVITGGSHGYDPKAFPDMHAIFMVSGPDIKKGLMIEPFSNVHIYPFIAHILGLSYSHSIDGDAAVLNRVFE